MLQHVNVVAMDLPPHHVVQMGSALANFYFLETNAIHVKLDIITILTVTVSPQIVFIS